ncbi:MAG: hypothetical protein HFI00_01985 [Lachnospiraceae bacterium]|jgi:FkbM family methyltransferase|nr:hypothetical protein [Lachnospiraceae bacterium]
MENKFMDRIVKDFTVTNSYQVFDMNKTDRYVLYGIGNLAEAVNRQFLNRGMKFELALVDDGYDIKESFMGIPVKKYSEFVSQMENRKKYSLVIGYAAGYRKKETICRENFFKHVDYITRPFEHHKAFDRKFVEEHEKEFELLYNQLEDDKSREILCAFINSRITENGKYVVDISHEDIDEFYNDVYKPILKETFLDIGAYQGGSINRFLKVASVDSINKVIGLEPEDNNFKILCRNLNYIDEEKKRLIKIGCYDEKTRLGFNNKEDKCCRLDENSDTFIDVDTVDHICIDEDFVTTMYIGISAAVLHILKGAEHTVLSKRPRMIINLGTLKEEVYSIPLYIKSVVPDYKLYFRMQSSMPSRMFLYAIP